MSQFSLRVYARRQSTDSVGELRRHISLEAQGPREAEQEARRYLSQLDWETQFAALLADDESQFLRFWLNEQM